MMIDSAAQTQATIGNSEVPKKVRLLFIAGGRSEEHNSTIGSARNLLEAASAKPSLDCSLLVITRDGRWLSEPDGLKALVSGSADTGGLPPLQGPPLNERFDVIFPIIDSWPGGGGSIQGMLEIADLPYVGCGVLTTALCMDKILTKELVSCQGVPTVRHLTFHRKEFLDDPESILRAVRQLNSPWFVKPVSLGSSFGITMVKEDAFLIAAIQQALTYDTRIIIEEGVRNAREFEVAIIGNLNPQSSKVAEILYDGEFYDKEAKEATDKSEVIIPADIPENMAQEMKTMALKIYRALRCDGFARVDFLLDPQKMQIYFNEINTHPGFGEISAFPKLMQAEGFSLGDVVETLINLAIEQYSEKSHGRFG